jgi:hypothetical protein
MIGALKQLEAGRKAEDGGWPTFTFFVKVGTTRSDATAFLSRQSELCFRRRGRSASREELGTGRTRGQTERTPVSGN